MTRFRFGFILFLCLSYALIQESYPQGEAFKGYFVTTEGKTIVATRFLNLNDERPFKCKYEGNILEIPINVISRIQMLASRQTLMITRRDGSEFVVQNSDGIIGGYGLHLHYEYYDKISQRFAKSSMDPVYIRKIVFDEDYGQLRKCEQCSRTFPPDYVFCPYDKSDLKLIRVK